MGHDGLAPSGSHGGAGVQHSPNTFTATSCSYPTYVKEQFYEYVAVIEMIYILSTDAAAREALFKGIEESDFWQWQESRSETLGHTFEFLKEKWFGDPHKAEAARQAGLQSLQSWEQHRSGFIESLKGYLLSYYDEIKSRYQSCGFLYAFATVSTDGAFMVGELALGAGAAGVAAKAVKALKFFPRRLPDGAIQVETRSPNGHSIERTLQKDDLEAKFGGPEDNHAGVLSDDANRTIPDEPAEGMAQRRLEERKVDKEPDGSYRDIADPSGMRRASDGTAMIKDRDGNWTRVDQIPPRSNAYKGQWGEAMADRQARADGWEKINGPDTTVDGTDTHGLNGIDGLYRNPSGDPDYFITDSKTGSGWLNKTQNHGVQLSNEWTEHHLQRMVDDGIIDEDMMDDILRSNKRLVQKVDDKGNVTLMTTDKQPWTDGD